MTVTDTGGEDVAGSRLDRVTFDAIAGLAHEMPLIGAMAMRNFTDILALLTEGRQLTQKGPVASPALSDPR